MMPARFNAFTMEPAAYRVIRQFEDFDGGIHPVGETWRYLDRNFFPYDAGLTLYIEKDGQSRSIRLQDYQEAQGPIIDGFGEYVEWVSA